MLLVNGDDARRCRDAHIEGKTIEETQSSTPESWLAQDSTSNQVPLIPASRGRGHNYATTYPRPFPGPLPLPLSPPALFFFFHLACKSGVRPTTNKTTVQRSGCSRPAFVRKQHPDLPSMSAHIYPISPSLYFLCPLAMRPGPIEYLSHAISASRLEAGQGCFV